MKLSEALSVYEVYYVNCDPTDSAASIDRDRYVSIKKIAADAMTDYQNEHPGRSVIGFYNSDSNAIHEAETMKNDFNELCDRYGFTPDDYNACIAAPSVEYHLIGFLPRNRKYPVLLINKATGRMTKASVGFTKRYMIRK